MTAGLILTQVGADEIEAAYRAGSVVNVITASFGDGGGKPVVASPAVTSLAGRFGEVPLAAGETVDGMIGGTAIIPCADYPGRIVREFGLESDSGTLIAYGAYPDTYLPGQSDSVIKELIVKFVMTLVHAECVTLVVDPTIAILTQEEGDKRYYRRSLRLQEVKDEGAAAQQTLRGNIGCGTVATKDVVTSDTDKTAGRIPTVEWAVPKTRKVNNKPLGTDINLTPQDIWGFSESIATARNINQIMTPGLYYVVRDDIAAQCTGLPENKAGELEVLLGAQRIQFYRLTATPRVYYRLGTGNNTWQAWVKQYDTQNKPTAADLGLGSASNYRAVHAGGGEGMNDNEVYLGWTGAKVKIQVDSSDMGEVYTTKFPPPGPDLSEYMRGDWCDTAGFVADSANDPYMRHTKTGEIVLLARRDWAVQSFVSNIRLANYGTVGTLRDSSNTVMTGIYATNGWDNPTTHEHRQVQYLIAGTWYNAAYV